MSDGDWHDVAQAGELTPGDVRAVDVAGRRVCVGRTEAAWFAVDDHCPHAGGSLGEGMVDGSQVICPLHGFAFEIEDGRCVDDPGCDVRVHATRVEGGRLQVRLT